LDEVLITPLREETHVKKYSQDDMLALEMEERRLRVFENRVLRRVFGP
jgi:hypothetical protein